MGKILITGINGMVASHLADLCIEKGDEVWGTYRWQEANTNVKHLIGHERFHMIPLNINDMSNCLKVIEQVKPDAISHLAAESYVGDSFDHPAETIKTNTLGTLNLLEAVRMVRDNEEMQCERWTQCRASNDFDPVIHVCSSSEVYGLVTEDLIPITEECRFNPSNPYAVGKVGTDMIALMYHTNYKLKTIRTRMFTHFSFRRTMLSAEVNFANQIAAIEELGVKENTVYTLYHGNLESIRTWADARDAVKAYYLILTQPKEFGVVYNIGGERTTTIGEMLKYMISLSPMKDNIELEQDPKLMRPYDVTLQIPDISKFQKDYPEWKPEISFEQSIQDLLNEKRRLNELER